MDGLRCPRNHNPGYDPTVHVSLRMGAARCRNACIWNGQTSLGVSQRCTDRILCPLKSSVEGSFGAGLNQFFRGTLYIAPGGGGVPICPGIGCGPMGICSGIEKNATIWRISAMKTMTSPTNIIVSAAPIRYSNPVVWNVPTLSFIATVS